MQRRIVTDLAYGLIAVSLFLTTYDGLFVAAGIGIAVVGAVYGRWRRKDARMSKPLLQHLLIITTLFAIGGWLAVGLLLTMLVNAAH